MIDKIILYIQIAATLYLVMFLLFCGYVVSEMIEFFYLIKSMDLKYRKSNTITHLSHQ
jgi:DNA primase large subunit